MRQLTSELLSAQLNGIAHKMIVTKVAQYFKMRTLVNIMIYSQSL